MSRRTLLGCVTIAATLALTAYPSTLFNPAHARELTLATQPAQVTPRPTKKATPRPAPNPRTIYALVTQYAERHGVPAHIAHGIVRTESQYNCQARSAHGALGIMQVLPRTARSVGVTGNLLTCENSLEAGMRYLKLALDITSDWCAALTLYNRGLYARPTCSDYARKVLRHATEYRAAL